MNHDPQCDRDSSINGNHCKSWDSCTTYGEELYHRFFFLNQFSCACRYRTVYSTLTSVTPLPSASRGCESSSVKASFTIVCRWRVTRHGPKLNPANNPVTRTGGLGKRSGGYTSVLDGWTTHSDRTPELDTYICHSFLA